MSSSQPPSNPLDEVKSGIQESPPHEEFKAGLADKQPLLQDNQPRYTFGWFDKWLLAIPAVLLLVLCLLAWVALNPATTPTAAPTASAAVTTISLNAPTGGTTATVGETITLSGQAPPGSEIQLLNRGKPISTTTADANGYYEFALSAAQPGVYELQTVTTINGQQVTSPTVTVTVTGPGANPTSVAAAATAGVAATGDNNAAAAATIAANATADALNASGANATAAANATGNAGGAGGDANATAAANATPAAGASGNSPTVSTPPDANLAPGQVLTGVAPPNSHVVIYFDGKEVGSADADANGAWQFTVPSTIPPGKYTMTVAVTDANGNPIGSPSEPQTVTIAAGADATPGSTSTAGGNGNAPTINTAPDNIVTAGTELDGTAPPNSHVVIYFDGKEVGSADADANGAWQFTVPSTIPPGKYTMTVAVTDANGNPVGSPSEPQTVTIAAGADATPGSTSGVNVTPPGINLGTNAMVTAGALVTGTAPPNSHVVFYLDGQEIGGADADANGVWQFTIPDNVPAGKHTVRVVVTDANGKPLENASQEQTVTIIAKPLLPVTGGEFK